MDTVFAMGVGAQKRTDKQHGSACGSHPAGQDCADSQDARVDHGRADQRAFEPHAARNGEEGEKQDYERNIVQQDYVQGLVHGCAQAIDKKTGHKEGEPPEDRYLAEVMLPEMRHCKRHDGN